MLHVTVGLHDGVTVVGASGPTDAHSLRDQLDERVSSISKSQLVVIDLGDVMFVDAAGVEDLVAWLVEISEGRPIRLAAPHLPARTVIAAVAAAAGVKIYASVHEAATSDVVDLTDAETSARESWEMSAGP